MQKSVLGVDLGMTYFHMVYLGRGIVRFGNTLKKKVEMVVVVKIYLNHSVCFYTTWVAVSHPVKCYLSWGSRSPQYLCKTKTTAYTKFGKDLH